MTQCENDRNGVKCPNNNNFTETCDGCKKPYVKVVTIYAMLVR